MPDATYSNMYAFKTQFIISNNSESNSGGREIRKTKYNELDLDL